MKTKMCHLVKCLKCKTAKLRNYIERQRSLLRQIRELTIRKQKQPTKTVYVL